MVYFVVRIENTKKYLYYEEEAYSSVKGNYIGIIFECESILYELKAVKSVKPDQIDVKILGLITYVME